MRYNWLRFLLLAPILLTGPVYAQQQMPPQMSEAMRNALAALDIQMAKPEEIFGSWKLVQSPPGINKIEPWPMPFQYFSIMPDGRIASMMTTTEQKDLTGKSLVEIFNHGHWNHFELTASGSFINLTYWDHPDKNEVWMFKAVHGHGKLFGVDHEPGDLTMTWVTKDAAGNVAGIYTRHLRKLPE